MNTPPPGRLLKILVAEDDTGVRRMLASELGKQYQTTVTPDGAEALKAARLEAPDVLVTDVVMPHMDGHTLCRALRAEPQFRKTSIIVMTGGIGADAVIASLEVGADDCITKPFEIRELIARIEAQVRVRSMERSLAERETRLAAIGTLASSVVHDVRNGLTALLARTDFARTKRPDGSVQRDLTIIEGLAVRLNRNLQDILDFARGDDVKLRRQNIFADELVARVEDELTATFRHARVELRIALEGAIDVPLNVDVDRLHGAVENLLLNARAAVVTTRRDKAQVALTIQVAADEVNIIVDDNGGGIPPEILTRLFNKFETHSASGGNGLGLTTVRNVARAHGGEVHAVGHGPLGGARFHLWLPNVQPV